MRNRSISRDLTISLALVVFLASTIVILLSITLTARKDRAELEKKGDEYLSYLIDSLELPIWTLDDEVIQKIGTSFVNNEFVALIRVTEPDGNDLFSRVEGDAHGLLLQEREVYHEGTLIGRIELGLAPRLFEEAHRRQLWSNAITMLVVIAVLVFMTGLLLRIFLRNPLNELVRGIDRIADGDYDYRPEGLRRAETEAILDKFNRMAGMVKERERSLSEINQRLAEEIAQHQKAEEALRRSEARYRALFEESPISLWEEDFSEVKTHLDLLRNSGIEDLEAYFDAHPEEVQICTNLVRIIDVNQATLDLFKAQSKEELMGSLDRIIPEGSEDLLRVEYLAMARGEAFENECLNRTLTGKELRVLVKCSVPSGYEGTWSRVFLSMHDLTERVEAEENQRKLEAQLRRAQRLESIGTLAGGIAHDFNNLLMGIQGNVSLMLTDLPSDHPFRKRLQVIDENVRSGTSLTNQLLGFARGGKYEVKPTDLNRLLRETADMFGRTRKEVVIRKDLQDDLWSVEVDRGQIEQVLLNLYVNAWQSMPGGGTICLETRNVELWGSTAEERSLRPGRYAAFAVQDDGSGMSRDVLERVFDPFFTTKEMGRGTGLGLASAYGIIKNHDGTIEVHSRPGEGARFDVYLPASDRKVRRDEAPPGDAARGAGTILLVDDEDVVLDVSRQFLERLGFEVVLASGGQEALDVYRDRGNQIDLVILDMVMPGMGGGEAFDALRRINPGVAVLLSSGYSLDGHASEILARGCNGFIQKPFDMAELSERIEEVLESCRSNEAAGQTPLDPS